MTPSEKAYRRLPGKGMKRGGFFSGMAGKVTLWLGDDHFLLVESTGWEEEYKRFYYRDVQAIILHRTARDKVWSGIWSVLILICLLLLLTVGGSGIPAGILGGVSLVCFGINWLRGPTCACQVRTAVQTEDLFSLHRLKTAQKVLNALVPLIVKAQGQLPTEQLPQIVATLPQVAAAPSALGQARELKKIYHYNGRWHEALFFFMLVYGVFNIVDFFYNDPVLQIFDLLFSSGVLVCLIGAMVKQHQSDLPAGLKRVVWITLGFQCIFVWVCMIGCSVTVALKHRGRSEARLGEYMEFTSLPAVDLITAICVLPLGILGLIQLMQFRANYKPPVHAHAAPPGPQPTPKSTNLQDPPHPVMEPSLTQSPPKEEPSHGDSGPATLR